ncbi:MAG: recombinase RecT [Clostridia bacterium]|nr:recombinase RecT [Clostridia bacterium]
MREKIISILSDIQEKEAVENYASYCQRLLLEKTKDGKLKNPFMQYKKPEELANLFRRVLADGLIFDGKHITLQSTGISYDYIAYKNKMLLAYPESKIDVSVVSDKDEFSFSKENGLVSYEHKIKEPFGNNNIVGAYCVIKNNRGEFLTMLNMEEIDKHRKVAKTDYIWQSWFKEMVLKTVIKKACKQHFDDVYTKIEELDNENYDLENPLDIDIKVKQEIEATTNEADLNKVYAKYSGLGKEFDKLVVEHREFIKNADKE